MRPHTRYKPSRSSRASRDIAVPTVAGIAGIADGSTHTIGGLDRSSNDSFAAQPSARGGSQPPFLMQHEDAASHASQIDGAAKVGERLDAMERRLSTISEQLTTMNRTMHERYSGGSRGDSGSQRHGSLNTLQVPSPGVPNPRPRTLQPLDTYGYRNRRSLGGATPFFEVTRRSSLSVSPEQARHFRYSMDDVVMNDEKAASAASDDDASSAENAGNDASIATPISRSSLSSPPPPAIP